MEEASFSSGCKHADDDERNENDYVQAPSSHISVISEGQMNVVSKDRYLKC